MNAPRQRMLYHCRGCGKRGRIDWHYLSGWHASVPTSAKGPFNRIRCECGRWTWEPKCILGTVTATPCGSACTNAKGHVCECSCGGENHGTGNGSFASFAKV